MDDDRQAITPEWLESLGFQVHRYTRPHWSIQLDRDDRLTTTLNLRWFGPASWGVDLVQTNHQLPNEPEDMVALLSFPDVPTRGHVRRLCEGLGVSLVMKAAAE